MNLYPFSIRRKASAIGLLFIFSIFSLFLQPLRPFSVQAEELAQPAISAVLPASIGGCPMFPANNVWNVPVNTLPVHAQSNQWVNSIGRDTSFHMDFGSGTWDGGPIGIPYNIVGAGVPKVPVSFYYPEESDAGPYPIPANPRREHGSDHHILIVDTSTCTLYELYDANYASGQWSAGSGAIWNLNSNALRPDTWTSADAAGLPILPGLVRYDEVLSGKIDHAIRFTASSTNGYIWPARHLTSDDPSAPYIPPMGARFRLKASFNVSGYPPAMQVILNAMKTYGIILADNGSDWYVSGAPDERWDNDMLHLLDDLTGDDFEAVDTSVLMVNYNSGATGSTISGNVGLAGVTLSYTDGTPKTVTSDGSGNYSIWVPYNWSGTVTPSKANYTFSPANRTYTSIVGNQTAQNYTAIPLFYSISGNTGIGGVTLSYTNGTPKTVISQADGSYSITVPRGWSGKVTPSMGGYIFSPVNRIYSSVIANQAAQNYTAIPLYSISGNAGAGGVILTYTDGISKTVTSQSNGNYSIAVPSGWTGTVSPVHPCFTFDPGVRSYTNLENHIAAQNYTPAFDAEVPCADIDISIGGIQRGRFGLMPGESTRASFSAVNQGPVKMASANPIPLIAAERLIYKVSNVSTSFSEMMGLPDSQVDTTYWLPWYNNATADLDTQLRLANISGATATVHVFIGETELEGSPLTLLAGESTRKSFIGVNNGPVRIVSDQPIVAAERVVYKVNNVNTSFTEMMALPNKQLDTTYWLPWYNNVDLDTQLRIANVSSSPAPVHVYIGGVEMPGSPFTLLAGESIRKSYTGVNSGPVRIVSEQNIVAAERVVYKVNNLNTSFSEMMGLPANQLNDTYWLPWYNNTADLDTQLRFANVSSSTASVHVYIAGQEMPGSPFELEAGASTRKSFSNVNNGPVQVTSDHGVPIVVAERVVYKVSNVNTSFSEMMALPQHSVDTIYWLPWYNNVDLDTQLRFGVP